MIFVNNLHKVSDVYLKIFAPLGEKFLNDFSNKLYNKEGYIASVMCVDTIKKVIPIVLYYDRYDKISLTSIIDRDYFKENALYLNNTTYINCTSYKEIAYDKKTNDFIWCIHLDGEFIINESIINNIESRLGRIKYFLNIK